MSVIAERCCCKCDDTAVQRACDGRKRVAPSASCNSSVGDSERQQRSKRPHFEKKIGVCHDGAKVAYYLGGLPAELACAILACLPLRDACRAAMASKGHATLLDAHSRLWRTFYLRDHGTPRHHRLVLPPMGLWHRMAPRRRRRPTPPRTTGSDQSTGDAAVC